MRQTCSISSKEMNCWASVTLHYISVIYVCFFIHMITTNFSLTDVTHLAQLWDSGLVDPLLSWDILTNLLWRPEKYCLM